MASENVTVLWAVALGALSAASLPLGSVIGLWTRPRASVAASLGAFGAGALIAALTLDLVAPNAEALTSGEHGAVRAFYVFLAGALAGGFLFVVLDRVLDERGAFLRKVSTTLNHVARSERARRATMVKNICAIPLIRSLPADEVSEFVVGVETVVFADGHQLYAEGDTPDSCYFVLSGSVDLNRSGTLLRSLGVGGILGELPLISGLPRSATATANGIVEAYRLPREHFERWRAKSPEFDQRFRALAQERLEEIRERDRERGEEEQRWGMEALAALRVGAQPPTPQLMRDLSEKHGGAGLAVWLGLTIDGIPESLVIGSGLLAVVAGHQDATEPLQFAQVIPYTLIAGLFLSNFPEALSSSLAMKDQGWGNMRIVSMWLGLFIMTAIGAGIGFAIGEAVPHVAFVGIEGMAAGAMLTAIASTMIPEAVHLGGSGSRVGLATLVGFLAATAFKLFE